MFLDMQQTDDIGKAVQLQIHEPCISWFFKP